MTYLVILSLGLLGLLAGSLALPSDPYATRSLCANTHKTCVDGEGTCTSGRCRCKRPYSKGKGNFRCYKPNEIGCEFKNDPQVKTFDDQVEAFPYPCRYLASHVKTDMRNTNGEPIGNCEARVFASNAKHLGKMFVHGFDVALKLIYNGPKGTVTFSFRHYGSANNNKNDVTETADQGESNFFVPDGHDDSSYTDDDNGIKIRFRHDSKNNRFTYSIEGCAMNISHVPYDRQLEQKQRQIPGLYISVDGDRVASFDSPDKSMCLIPKSYSGGQNLTDLEIPGLSHERMLLLRAWKSDVDQILPFQNASEVNQQCQAVGSLFSSHCQSSREILALQNCDWILKNPHFMKCYDHGDPNPVKLLSLFRRCVHAWCHGRHCTRAIDDIADSGCHSIEKVPELVAFMNGDMCPTNST